MEKRKTNKKFPPDVKLEVAVQHLLLCLRRERKHRQFSSVSQLCQHFGISRSHLREWGAILRSRGPEIFVHGSTLRRRNNAMRTLEKRDDYERKLEEKIEQLGNALALQSGPASEDRMTSPPKIAP